MEKLLLLQQRAWRSGSGQLVGDSSLVGQGHDDVVASMVEKVEEGRWEWDEEHWEGQVCSGRPLWLDLWWFQGEEKHLLQDPRLVQIQPMLQSQTVSLLLVLSSSLTKVTSVMLSHK